MCSQEESDCLVSTQPDESLHCLLWLYKEKTWWLFSFWTDALADIYFRQSEQAKDRFSLYDAHYDKASSWIRSKSSMIYLFILLWLHTNFNQTNRQVSRSCDVDILWSSWRNHGNHQCWIGNHYPATSQYQVSNLGHSGKLETYPCAIQALCMHSSGSAYLCTAVFAQMRQSGKAIKIGW